MKEVLLTEMWNKWFHTNLVYLGAFWVDAEVSWCLCVCCNTSPAVVRTQDNYWWQFRLKYRTNYIIRRIIINISMRSFSHMTEAKIIS